MSRLLRGLCRTNKYIRKERGSAPLMLDRAFLCLVGFVVLAVCAQRGDAAPADVIALREEARDLFERKDYAGSAPRWSEVGRVMAAAGNFDEAYWAYWRAGICENKMGDFGQSGEHLGLANGFLGKAMATSSGDQLKTHALNLVA